MALPATGETVARYAAASVTGDWVAYERWCEAVGVSAVPLQTATFLRFLSEQQHVNAKKPTTVQRRLAAISAYHRACGYASPLLDGRVREVWKGIRRTLKIAPEAKRALLVGDIRRIIETLTKNKIGARDRALILVGFAGALRRSELVALDVRDVKFDGPGAVLRLRSSKVNQDGAYEEVAIYPGAEYATCPIRALRGWLLLIGTEDGPVFRVINRHQQIGFSRLSPEGVAIALRRAVRNAGALVEIDLADVAAHSLRSGFATSSSRAGKTEQQIMRHGRWKTASVARRYIRAGDRWDDHPGKGIGL